MPEEILSLLEFGTAKICLWRAPAHRVDDDDDDPGESDALDTRHETSSSVDRDAQSSRKVVSETRDARERRTERADCLDRGVRAAVETEPRTVERD